MLINPAKKLAVNIAKKYDIFVLYNNKSIDLGDEGKMIDSHSVALAVEFHQEDLKKGIDKLHKATKEYLSYYKKVRDEAIKLKSHADLDLDKIVENLI